MHFSKGKALTLIVAVVCVSFFINYASMEKRQSKATNERQYLQSQRINVQEEQLAKQKPARPDKSSYEEALIRAISSAPLLVAVVEGRDYSNIASALHAEYDVTVVPRVGGGEVLLWSYKNAPEKTWIQVEHIGDNIFQVGMQIGLKTQRTMFLVDLNNGAVEKKLDTFSAQMGY
ncbi:MAG TPA: hypothetical protein VMX58_11120 [Patescibacteria group bacterium]|nr:hypothetical protein [Patescibacteria group bacterium]